MKSKDLQRIVESKYEKGDTPYIVFQDLNGGLSLSTIKRWFGMIRSTGSIDLSSPPGSTRLVRTRGSIEKVKNRVERNTRISTRKLARDLGISRTTIQRILKDDLGLKPYKKTSESMLTEEHKEKRKKFANWVRSNITKEETMKILFSDRKCSISMASTTAKMIVYGR